MPEGCYPNNAVNAALFSSTVQAVRLESRFIWAAERSVRSVP